MKEENAKNYIKECKENGTDYAEYSISKLTVVDAECYLDIHPVKVGTIVITKENFVEP